MLRKPVPEDGMSVFRLVASCPPLDPNSAYCNLLQCSHFANTSVAAIDAEGLVGFISAYVIPERIDTLFVWQVAVAETARGQGLAKNMLWHILARQECDEIKHIETTITQSNEASRNLFRSLAKDLNTEIEETVMFDRNTHFTDEHDTEFLIRLPSISKLIENFETKEFIA